MKDTIERLKKEKEQLQSRITKIDKAINAFQDVCVHNWEYEGHDSHKDYEKCTICGDSRSV